MGRENNISIIISGLLLAQGIAYADFADGLVGGLVGGAVGSVITNEIYHSNKKSHKSHRRSTHKSSKKSHYRLPKMTDEKRIQKTLSSLGFYHGKIDGEVNSYETRSAIKEMNMAYGISQSASLKPEARDILIYLGTLFEFDRYLIATGSDSRTKGRKIQAALKINGYYHGKIDGIIGRGTRTSIVQYKSDHGMSPTGFLDYEEEYRLISGAKEKNDNDIDENIQALKALGTMGRHRPKPKITPAPPPPPVSLHNEKKNNKPQPLILVPAKKSKHDIPETPTSSDGEWGEPVIIE